MTTQHDSDQTPISSTPVAEPATAAESWLERLRRGPGLALLTVLGFWVVAGLLIWWNMGSSGDDDPRLKALQEIPTFSSGANFHRDPKGSGASASQAGSDDSSSAAESHGGMKHTDFDEILRRMDERDALRAATPSGDAPSSDGGARHQEAPREMGRPSPVHEAAPRAVRPG